MSYAPMWCEKCNTREIAQEDYAKEEYEAFMRREQEHEAENCGCSTDLPPILIEVNSNGTDNVKYSGKVEKDIDQMVKELGVDADAALLYCHRCSMVFTAGDLLAIHKMETGHS